MKDLYEILQVERNASPEAIKDSYRSLAKQLHPDMNGQDAFASERFKDVQEAFEVLSDESKRKEYDERLKAHEQRIVSLNLSIITNAVHSVRGSENPDEHEYVFFLPEGYSLDSNPELKKAYALICVGAPVVLLTGGAGTGKSTFINYIRNNLRKDTGKNCIVLSPTGVSALNVRGQTIHSFFHFPARDFDDEEINRIRKNPLVDKTDLIIIDEISQVESAMLDHIDYALCKWTLRAIPFGGIQMLLTGDYFQLSPWIKYGTNKARFMKKWKSQFFFDAHVFEQVEVQPIRLTHIYRQRDMNFIDLLNTIRTCADESKKRAAVDYLNKNCLLSDKIQKGSIPQGSLFLTTRNDKADSYNEEKLLELFNEGRQAAVYKASIVNIDEKTAERIPTPSELLLCEGARVMVTRNIRGANGRLRLVNGSTGTVRELKENSVVIQSGDITEELFPVSWEICSYEWDDGQDTIASRVLGSFLQIPLRLGWAVTIHKAQGMTLDSAVIDAAESFAPGQVYVALSRCRSLDGLYLKEPLNEKTVFADPTVQMFDRTLEMASEQL